MESILEIGDGEKNALNNIWNTEAGVKIAEGTNCYIEFNAELNAIKFYTID